MEGREAPVPADNIEGEVEMEGDDVDVREEGRESRAASDAVEDDECSDMTCVGREVVVEVVGWMGEEGTVEGAKGVRGSREELVMTLATLDIADTTHL